MVVVVEQDMLGLQQLSPKFISTRVITKYGKLHYSMLIRVVESCTMVLIQHQHTWALHLVQGSYAHLYLGNSTGQANPPGSWVWVSTGYRYG